MIDPAETSHRPLQETDVQALHFAPPVSPQVLPVPLCGQTFAAASVLQHCTILSSVDELVLKTVVPNSPLPPPAHNWVVPVVIVQRPPLQSEVLLPQPVATCCRSRRAGATWPSAGSS
ncbi:MAG TPA: hypothetical protein VFT22_02905 [Kofleriaceae bacterium]|nr:hypothetical protein [Kofleriaceae bacterium]